MSAALAPEEFELVIPEKKTNLPQVPTYLGYVEFAQSIHQTHEYASVGDIQETYVKVLNTRAEPAHFGVQLLKPLRTLQLAAGTVLVQCILELPWPCQWITVRLYDAISSLRSPFSIESIGELFEGSVLILFRADRIAQGSNSLD